MSASGGFKSRAYAALRPLGETKVTQVQIKQSSVVKKVALFVETYTLSLSNILGVNCD